MVHPLDGARLKVVRAEEHLNALKLEIGAYLESKPYVVATHFKVDRANPGKGPVTITKPPPVRCSLLIGDCVTNLRATLDYIAWELASRYFSPPLKESSQKDRRFASFCLSDDPSSVRDHMAILAKRHVPATAISLIEAVQPYNGGYEPLSLLTKLVNTDKHRMPLLTISYIPAIVWASEGDGRITSIGLMPIGLDDETERSRRAMLKDMGVEADISICVTFKDITMPREPVDRTLENVLKTVADIIPRFDQFF